MWGGGGGGVRSKIMTVSTCTSAFTRPWLTLISRGHSPAFLTYLHEAMPQTRGGFRSKDAAPVSFGLPRTTAELLHSCEWAAMRGGSGGG